MSKSESTRTSHGHDPAFPESGEDEPPTADKVVKQVCKNVARIDNSMGAKSAKKFLDDAEMFTDEQRKRVAEQLRSTADRLAARADKIDPEADW
jgi:hypothetical protein